MNSTKIGKQCEETHRISGLFERDYEVLGSPEKIALNEKVNQCLEKEGLEQCSKFTCPKDRPCFCDAFMERGGSNVKDLERALNLPLSTGLASVKLDAAGWHLDDQFNELVKMQREAGGEEAGA